MSIKNTQQLKQLQSRKAKLEAELKLLNTDKKEIYRKLSHTKKQLKGIAAEISSLKNKEIVVSEHAMLRYLERSMGLDLIQLRDDILTDQLKTQINALGNGKYPVGDGCKAVVKDRIIVSIVE